MRTVALSTEQIQALTTELAAMSTAVASNTIAVLDAVIQRGAIKGEEMTTLGQLRDNCLRTIKLAETLQLQAETYEPTPEED
jgi:hypothetical protein